MLDDGMCELCEGQVKTDAMLRCSSECAVMPGQLRKLSTDFVIMLTCRAKLKHVLIFMNLSILMCNVYAIMLVQLVNGMC